MDQEEEAAGELNIEVKGLKWKGVRKELRVTGEMKCLFIRGGRRIQAGMSLACRETQHVKGHTTFWVHSGECAIKVSKGRDFQRETGVVAGSF